MQINFN